MVVLTKKTVALQTFPSKGCEINDRAYNKTITKALFTNTVVDWDFVGRIPASIILFDSLIVSFIEICDYKFFIHLQN